VGAVAVTRPDSASPPPVAASTPTRSGTARLAFTAILPTPITASAQLVDMAWGTRIDLTCAYRKTGSLPARGLPYALVVIDRSGVPQQVAAWKALPGQELTVLGASSLTRRDIAAVEIRTLTGIPLLRLNT